MDFIGAKDDGGLEVVVTTGTIRRAKRKPTPNFYTLDALPASQATVSAH